MIPIVLMALIALLSPSYLTPLFHEPTGRLALVFASVCIVLGFYVISRIASLKA
jgi:tight adherence protein B